MPKCPKTLGTLYACRCHGNNDSDLRSDRQQPVMVSFLNVPREPWQWTLGWNASLQFLWNPYLWEDFAGILRPCHRILMQSWLHGYVFCCFLYYHSVLFTVGFHCWLENKTCIIHFIKTVTLGLEGTGTEQTYLEQRWLISSLKCKTLLNSDHVVKTRDSTVQQD